MSAVPKTSPVPSVSTSGEASKSLHDGGYVPIQMTPQTIKVACSSCNLRELCMPVGLNDVQMQRIDEVVATRRKIKRGGTLFRNGEECV